MSARRPASTVQKASLVGSSTHRPFAGEVGSPVEGVLAQGPSVICVVQRWISLSGGGANVGEGSSFHLHRCASPAAVTCDLCRRRDVTSSGDSERRAILRFLLGDARSGRGSRGGTVGVAPE